jgi:hypothetical protein
MFCDVSFESEAVLWSWWHPHVHRSRLLRKPVCFGACGIHIQETYLPSFLPISVLLYSSLDIPCYLVPMIFKPATPGFLVTLIATILLAIVSFSVPLFKSVFFLKVWLFLLPLDPVISHEITRLPSISTTSRELPHLVFWATALTRAAMSTAQVLEWDMNLVRSFHCVSSAFDDIGTRPKCAAGQQDSNQDP